MWLSGIIVGGIIVEIPSEVRKGLQTSIACRNCASSQSCFFLFSLHSLGMTFTCCNAPVSHLTCALSQGHLYIPTHTSGGRCSLGHKPYIGRAKTNGNGKLTDVCEVWSLVLYSLSFALKKGVTLEGLLFSYVRLPPFAPISPFQLSYNSTSGPGPPL